MERAKFPTVPETAIDPLQWNVAERGNCVGGMIVVALLFPLTVW
jgi:hypothetical protein